MQEGSSCPVGSAGGVAKILLLLLALGAVGGGAELGTEFGILAWNCFSPRNDGKENGVA